MYRCSGPAKYNIITSYPIKKIDKPLFEFKRQHYSLSLNISIVCVATSRIQVFRRFIKKKLQK